MSLLSDLSCSYPTPCSSCDPNDSQNIQTPSRVPMFPRVLFHRKNNDELEFSSRNKHPAQITEPRDEMESPVSLLVVARSSCWDDPPLRGALTPPPLYHYIMSWEVLPVKLNHLQFIFFFWVSDLVWFVTFYSSCRPLSSQSSVSSPSSTSFPLQLSPRHYPVVYRSSHMRLLHAPNHYLANLVL